jgi:hypothetical protein
MKIDDLKGKKLYIMMGPHGVDGVAVETNDSAIRDTIRQISKAMKRDHISPRELKQIHMSLAAELTKMLPSIAQHGNAVDSKGEFYDTQTFDTDLVLCAVYDHLANGTPIQVNDNIGPGKSDTVHE